MTPRQTPSIRQRRFGAELRRLREAAGMSAPTAAELLGSDRTMISNIESGRFGISEARLRRLASIYECDDVELISCLVTMTGGRKTGWWDEYRGKILLDFSTCPSLNTMRCACGQSRPHICLAFSRPRITHGPPLNSPCHPCPAWKWNSE